MRSLGIGFFVPHIVPDGIFFRGFILGIPLFATLIALCIDKKPVLGIIDFPALNQRYVGVKGQVSTLNDDTPLSTTGDETLSNSIYCSTSPEMFSNDETIAVKALRKGIADMRHGTDAFGFAALAQGRAHGVIESDLKPYDFAAVVPVVEGAGGIITDWEGKTLTLESGPQVLASANTNIHKQALELVAKKVVV